MSKKSTNRRKNKRGKQHGKARPVASERSCPRKPQMRVRDVVDYADRMIGRGRWREAREALEQFERANPGQPDVLRLLLDVYHQQRDYAPYCRVCQKLLDKEPGDPELHLMLAGGYLADARMASSLRTFRRFLDRWPNHPFADGARQSVAQLEPAVDELLKNYPFPENEKIELAAMHEEVLACLSASEHQRAITLAERLLSRSSHFIPAMNNVSQAYFWAGQADKAIAASRRVLDLDPGNFHALANLTRYLLLAGRNGEADVLCERLRLARSENPEIWTKKAETFSFFGDDQAVLDALDEAKRNGYTKGGTPDVALLYHLAAVVHARQGRTAPAQRLWRDARKIYPGLDLPDKNLEDAKKPPSERHGPWAFSLDYWLPKQTIEELCAAVADPARRKDDESVGRAAQRFAEKHPEVASLVPALLDRGDEAGREFAWRFARLVETPELLEALREFCLSQRGPDSLRIETANYLCRKGVLASGCARMWLRGQWREIEMFGFEITEEPVGPTHSPPVDDWAYDALQAIKRGDGERAENLLRKCLEAEGDHPDLLNNLAMAYQTQDRQEEVFQLIRQIHQRWPDYFFGRISMARMAINDGDYQRAEQYLAPLRQRRLLHRTEFAAMCAAHIQLFLGRRDFDAAGSWFETWKEVDPDHPDLKRLKPTLVLGKAISRLSKRIIGRRR